MEPNQYKHYKITRPAPTHTRRATCAEVECPNYVNGWLTKVDESTGLGKHQADYIRANRKGQFKEYQEGELTCFLFGPNFECFNSNDHKIAIEREPFYIVQTAGSRRVHENGADWVEDFAEHQNRLAAAQK